MLYTRRDLGKLALAAPLAGSLKAAKINSVIDGIQFGAITYSFSGMTPDQIIQAMVDVGLGEVELMSNHCEQAAGAPSAGRGGYGGGGGRGVGGGGGAGAPLTPEQQAAQAEAQKKLADWRASATAATWKAVAKKFNDAGIEVAILCYNMNASMTDDMIEYAFSMAEGLGVKAISASTTVAMAKRLAPFGAKRQMRIGYHGHDNVTDPNQVATPESFETLMSYGEYNWCNLDIGHYTAAGFDPVAFIEKHHDRITNLHVKDMKVHGAYVPFGTGDTPMKGVMQLLKKGQYGFPANIEMERPIVENNDPVATMKKCFDYCKSLLA
jgi:sugar phosphate isomerase/epimerase